MNRTTRRVLPAVVVFLALVTGLAAAATFGSPAATRAPSDQLALTAERASATTTSIVTTSIVTTSSIVTTTTTERAAPTRPATTTTTTSARSPVSSAASRPSDQSATDPRAACGASVGGYRPATQAEFDAAITGAWLLCQPPSIFGTSETGMEIRADGRWSKLEAKSNGVLERTEGWGNEGVWETVDTSAMNGPGSFQLNMRVDGSTGTTSLLPAFGDTKLELSNEGVFVADYVPVPAGTQIVPAPAGPPPVPGDPCDTRRDAAFSPATLAEFDTTITGRWLLCGQTSVFGTNDAGLEIRADGQWNKLLRRADGSIVAATGLADAGTWQSFDVSAMNGHTLFQLNLTARDGSVVYTLPAFAVHGDHVSKMRLDNEGVTVGDYVPLPPGTRIATS